MKMKMIIELLNIIGFWVFFVVISLWGQRKLKIGAWENDKDR